MTQRPIGWTSRTAGELIEAVRAEDEHRVAPNFAVDFRRSYTSWGADGAAQTLVRARSTSSGIGATAVVGNAAYDALKAAVLRIAKSWREQSGDVREPLGHEEAVQRARWHVIRRFELKTDDETSERPTLVVAGEQQRADGSWLVRFRDEERRSEVELVDEAGLVLIGRIGWTDEG